MSTDETPNAAVSRDSRDLVREKAALVQAQQRRRHLVRTTVIVSVVVVLVVAAGVAVTASLLAQSNKPELVPAGMPNDAVVVSSLTPAAMQAAGVPSTQPTDAATTGAPMKIDVYLDYLSTDSAAFNAANAAQLSEWIARGAAEVSFHPVALLTAKSNGTKYSLRAAAAAACVSTHAPETFFAFNNALLSQQPQADSDGLSDEELGDVAQGAGAVAPGIVRGCIERGDFVTWVQDATSRALSTELGTTGEPLLGPTVIVNGTPYVGAMDSAKEFAQFVLTLSSDAYYATPSPTPTP